MMTKFKSASIAKLREVCAALPGATQDIKWGEVLVFSVGEKMFATTHTDVGNTFSFKVDQDRFLDLTDRPGIIPAPYMARFKWVQISDPKAISLDEAIELVTRSYQLVFSKLTKKMQMEISHG